MHVCHRRVNAPELMSWLCKQRRARRRPCSQADDPSSATILKLAPAAAVLSCRHVDAAQLTDYKQSEKTRPVRCRRAPADDLRPLGARRYRRQTAGEAVQTDGRGVAGRWRSIVVRHRSEHTQRGGRSCVIRLRRLLPLQLLLLAWTSGRLTTAQQQHQQPWQGTFSDVTRLLDSA